MNRIFRADRFAGELAGAVRDHFVRVRVRARAGTGLENIEREMLVELPFHDFFRRLDDERAPVRIEQAEISVRLGGSPFDQPEGANERPGKSIAADREIQDRALRGRAIKRGLRARTFRPSSPFRLGSAPDVMPNDDSSESDRGLPEGDA